MNDLSAQAILTEPRNSKPRVAVMVDGENVSQALAGQIIVKAGVYGDLVIRRVYGNAAKLQTWDSAPGFRFVHSGVGKNATDILLSVEAMEVMLNRKADILIIASSDRDYTHLVVNLREAGHFVIGLGEEKSPETYRKSCSKFLQLGPQPPAQLAPLVAPAVVKASALDEKVVDLIQSEGDRSGMLIGKLGGRMHTLHKIKIGAEPEKNWRTYLLNRPEIFVCDPRGSEAKVKLVKG